MNSHTPGPWFNNPSGPNMRENYSQSRAIGAHNSTGSFTLVAGVFSDVAGGSDVAEANAKLIAAAPELLAALKLMLEKTPYSETREWVADQARAAIAKATS